MQRWSYNFHCSSRFMSMRRGRACAPTHDRRKMKQIIEEYGVCAVLIFVGGVILKLMQILLDLI